MVKQKADPYSLRVYTIRRDLENLLGEGYDEFDADFEVANKLVSEYRLDPEVVARDKVEAWRQIHNS